jgi:hypothetical protein
MANKRPPIEVTEISQNLKDSTGRGMNAFFSQPPPAQIARSAQEKKAPVLRNHGTGVPGNRGTTVPGERREIARRHPFDVYADQLRILKKFSMEEKLAGQLGSESAMVREAIDSYIAKRSKK